MKKLKGLSFFTIALLLTGNSLYAQQEWSLEKCIDYAKSNNLQIKQQQLNVQQSENTLLQSKLSYIPSLNASLGHNMSWGRSVDLQTLQIIQNKLSQGTSANLSSSIVLFEGLRKNNTIKSSKKQLEIANLNVEKLKNDIAVQITRAYLQVLLSYEIEKTANESYKSVSEQAERTKKLVDAGSQAYSTLLEIQAQLANEKVQLVTARNNVRTNLLTLVQLLDMNTIDDFKIENPNIDNLFLDFKEGKVLDIYNSALNLPQIKSSELSLENSRLQYKIQKGAALPTLSFSAGYGTYYSDSQQEAFFTQFNHNKNPSIGFSLSIPIFNSWRTNTAIRNARLSVKNSELELRNSQQTLLKEIQQAYNDALSCFEKYKAAQQNMISMEESFSYTKQKFDLGMLNGTDYTVAKTNLFKSQSEFYQTKFQYIFQLKILDFYRGIPLTL